MGMSLGLSSIALSNTSKSVGGVVGNSANDNFNRADGALGTSSGGGTWVTNGVGAPTVVSNQLSWAVSLGVGSIAYPGFGAKIDTGVINRTTAFDLIIADGGGAANRFFLRYLDDNNCLGLVAQRVGFGPDAIQLQLYQVVTGVQSLVTTFTNDVALGPNGGGTWAAGTLTCSAVLSGTSLTLTVNGVTAAPVTIPAGTTQTFFSANMFSSSAAWVDKLDNITHV